IHIVLCAKIGNRPKEQLSRAGLRVTDAYGHDYIETAVSALYAAEFGIRPLAATA
ncbi:MAG: nitrogenase cofactor biosynthesis protein NifB, partial [Mesorhizobium sp.]